MKRGTVSKGEGMTIARMSAAAALALGVGMLAQAAVAQPAATPARPATQPPASAAPATPAPATPAPGAPAAPVDPNAPTAAPGEPPPPTIGPDGLPIPPTDPNAAPPAEVTPPPAPAPEISITPIDMFLHASIVVQVVMTMLMLWSITTWALLFSKLSYFSGLGGKTDRFISAFRNASSIEDAAKIGQKSYKDNPLAAMVAAAADEIKLSAGNKMSGEQRQHLLSRIAQRMSIVQAEQADELGTGMGIFATVGSISAFVGLFGTVWGIMNSFIGIAQKQTTNLAVVAPGIAEALFATGIGLFAAVPAVVFYNIFARRIGAYSTRMDNFASEVLVRLSRQLDGA